MKKYQQTSLAFCLIVAFLLNACGPIPMAHAEDLVSTLLQSKEQGLLVHLSPAFTPAHVQGMTLYPQDPLKFEFLISRGDERFADQQKKGQYTTLIKYF